MMDAWEEWHGRRVAVVPESLYLHVVEAGPSDGPLTILLHGFPEFWFGWRRQIGPLAEAGRRVLVPDQRGYGLSDKPAAIDDYHIDRLAADVVGLADAVGRERFSLVGHDWGGIAAWWVAHRYPERVERLAVLNAPHPAVAGRFARRHPSQLARSWYLLALQVPALPEAVLSVSGFRVPAGILRATSRPGTFDEVTMRRYHAAWAQPGALRGMIAWYRALRRFRPPGPELLQVPTLILWGTRDPFLDRRLSEESARLCTDARVVHLEDTGHWLHHECADVVNRHLAAFL